MTDKEQIIIDGVDVSNCEYYKQAFTGFICTNPNKSNDCSKNPDCYFKQLARKTQEYEELKFCTEILSFKYKKCYSIIEEIEKVCLEDTYTFADGTQIRYDSLDEILNIINKVKGEGTCQ